MKLWIALLWFVSFGAFGATSGSSIGDGGVHCLRNKETGKFLSDSMDTLWDLCSSGEKWDVTLQEDQFYCIRNNYLRKYLGSQGGAYSQVCSRGEQWELVPEIDGSYCLRNRVTSRFLSANLSMEGSCEKNEKWTLIPIL